MNRTHRPTWGRLALLAGFVLPLAGPALAPARDASRPATAPAGGPNKVYSHSQLFKLPVTMDERERADSAELLFFARALPGEWAVQETAPASQTAFPFRPPHDGEYWFTVLRVDKSGRRIPANPDQVPPGLIVVIDTQPPEVEVQKLPVLSGKVFLQCIVRDDNPDYASIQMEYLAADQTWKPLPQVPDTPGVFDVPEQSVLTGKVRVAAADKAGNRTQRTLDLAGPAPALPRAVPPPDSLQPIAGPYIPPARDPEPLPKEKPAPSTSEKPAELPLVTDPPGTSAVPSPAVQPKPVVLDPLPLPAPLPPAGPTVREAAKPPAAVQLINTSHCTLDYALEPPDGKGIGRVEVWATRDGGKTWQSLGEDADRKSPAEFELPAGDGVYGLLVVVTRAGGTAGPPAAGDTPDWWVEVDTTKPTAELTGVRRGGGDEFGSLFIDWKASDKNFGPDPVCLLYALGADGPWLPIARGLPASGPYRWPLPPELGPQVFVRLEATDRAGNVTRCDTPTPTVLEAARPRARVLSLTPGAMPRAGTGG